MIPANYDVHREHVLSILRRLITQIEDGKVVCISVDFGKYVDFTTRFGDQPQRQTITLEVYRGIKTTD